MSKYMSEVPKDPVFDLGHIDLAIEKPAHRRDRLALAGDDPVVIAQVCVYV